MKNWQLKTLDLKPRLPEILSSSDVARAIVLDLAAGESLSDHEVRERADALLSLHPVDRGFGALAQVLHPRFLDARVAVASTERFSATASAC